MIQMRLSEAADRIGARRFGEDVRFRGCSVDSRSVAEGQMYIALRGENHDGHDFVNDALARGASCALLQRLCADDSSSGLRVEDTCVSMGDLAQAWRQDCPATLIAVTGSNGKTTVKEMLGSVLTRTHPPGADSTLVTAGNLNNHIGVPLTLFALSKTHRYAVVEMGASAAGEIERLASISRPEVAVITQCAPAHLEGFGSLDGVAKAKAEIYSALDADGVAVINADDPYAEDWRECSKASRQLFFSMRQPADVYASDVRMDAGTLCCGFDLHVADQTVAVSLPLHGRHNVMNALAAAACAHAVGIGAQQIAAGLQACGGTEGRLSLLPGVQGIRVADDSYNANPTSLRAALETLSCLEDGHVWLVLGDMGELGESAQELHADSGRMAREAGVEKLFALGELSAAAATAFGDGARHFSTHAQLLDALRSELRPGVTVLVKGSRFMKMERITRQLRAGGH